MGQTTYLCGHLTTYTDIMNTPFSQLLRRWALLTIAIFFIYDIVWILTNPTEFLQGNEEGCGWICSDLIYCATFSLVSNAVFTLLFRSKRFTQLTSQNRRHVLLLTGGAILLCNLLVAVLVKLTTEKRETRRIIRSGHGKPATKMSDGMRQGAYRMPDGQSV